MTQSVECLTLGISSGHDLMVKESSRALGSVSTEFDSDSPHLSHSLSLSQIKPFKKEGGGAVSLT